MGEDPGGVWYGEASFGVLHGPDPGYSDAP